MASNGYGEREHKKHKKAHVLSCALCAEEHAQHTSQGDVLCVPRRRCGGSADCRSCRFFLPVAGARWNGAIGGST
jgi:hypothetical protein